MKIRGWTFFSLQYSEKEMEDFSFRRFIVNVGKLSRV